MAATRKDIQGWFESGIEQGATHLIVVCDTYDHDDYPVYVLSGQDAMRVKIAYNSKSMQRVMEVYNLSLSMESQLDEARSFNY